LTICYNIHITYTYTQHISIFSITHINTHNTQQQTFSTNTNNTTKQKHFFSLTLRRHPGVENAMVKGATTRTRQKVALIINTLLRGRAPLQKEEDEAGRTSKDEKSEKGGKTQSASAPL
jgi:hypothetical protein